MRLAQCLRGQSDPFGSRHPMLWAGAVLVPVPVRGVCLLGPGSRGDEGDRRPDERPRDPWTGHGRRRGAVVVELVPGGGVEESGRGVEGIVWDELPS